MPANRRSPWLLIWLSLVLVLVSSTTAQVTSTPNNSSRDTTLTRARPKHVLSNPADSSADRKQTPTGSNSLKVTETCQAGETSKEIDNRLIKNGDRVIVTVCLVGLPDYVQKNNLRLSIGGEVLSTPPELGSADQDYLKFVLQLNEQDNEDWSVWSQILEESLDAKGSEGNPLPITVAKDNQPVESEAFVKIRLSSCADLEEAAAVAQEPQGKQQQPSSRGGRTAPLMPEVIHGWSPLVTSGLIRMGQQVTVCVMNLKSWTFSQKNSPSDLRLSIGGHVLSMNPTVGPVDQEYVNFVLQLDNTKSNDWNQWAQILDAMRQNTDSNGNHVLPITVVNGNETFESEAFVEIVPYPNLWYLLFGLLILLFVALVYFAKNTDLLRYVTGDKPAPPLRAPYSLGITQMAFWFYLAVAGYVFICATTRQPHIPMGSVLGLLGISSTTGLAAVLVDKQKDASGQSRRDTLIAEQAALKARITELQAMAAPISQPDRTELSDKQTRFNQVNALIAQLPPPAPPATTKGFVTDLLHDGDGVSFHRFQMIVWTIVLGVVFVWSVYRTISMPEFDASLLTLMGISAGTYVGFKFPEKPKT